MSGLPGLRARPVWLLLGWTMVFLIVYLSLTPAPVELPMGQGDKIGHVLAYATSNYLRWLEEFRPHQYKS